MAFRPETFSKRFRKPPEVWRGMPDDDVMKVLIPRTASYEDLSGFPIKEKKKKEQLVSVPDTVGLTYLQRSSGIFEATGTRVFLREGIVKRLIKAGKDLDKEFPGYKIGILEGYRPYEQQVKEFEEAKAAVINKAADAGEKLSDMQIKNLAHLRSAAPDVGGHVAGAAFDFMLVNPDGVQVQMGTAMSEWVDRSWQHHPDISEEGKRARETAARILAKYGIKIFEGEFWHGHYGDVEYAWLNNWKHAIYGPVVNFLDVEGFKKLSSKGRRFVNYLGRSLGSPLQLPSDQPLPDGLRDVDLSEPIGLQRNYQPSDGSPIMPMAERRTIFKRVGSIFSKTDHNLDLRRGPFVDAERGLNAFIRTNPTEIETITSLNDAIHGAGDMLSTIIERLGQETFRGEKQVHTLEIPLENGTITASCGVVPGLISIHRSSLHGDSSQMDYNVYIPMGEGNQLAPRDVDRGGMPWYYARNEKKGKNFNPESNPRNREDIQGYLGLVQRATKQLLQATQLLAA